MPVSKEIIKEIALRHDSFYLYDENSIIERTGKLRACFPDVDFLYSVKCNHNRQVLESVFSRGFGADAASLGEVLAAAEHGLQPKDIYFSAPGKTVADLKGAWDKAVIIADSTGEIGLLEEIAAGKGSEIEIGVRINPDFAFGGGAGLPSKFGIDEELFFNFEKTNCHPHVKITGIHVHLRSQELNADALAGYYRGIMNLASRIEESTGNKLDYINLGSGIGIPYSENDTEPDLDSLAKALKEILAGRSTRILIETGRYAVCKCGYYVTKVLDRKVSRGRTYIILKNTLNGFSRPSLARFVEHYAGDRALPGTEPLYTGRNSFGFFTLKDGGEETETVDLVGNLCTAADVIAENVTMPRLERGDVVIISNAGAYAAVLSPRQFSSQEKPAEVFVKADGTETE